MKTLVALLAFLVLLAPRVWANCTVTGTVFNPDGTPLANGTVQFNSVVQQTLQGGAVIPPTQVSTPTNAQGIMTPISLVPGLQGQFVFCSPAAGGCGNPTPVLIPIGPTADISSILIGIQLQTGANVNASSLNVSGNSTMGGTLSVTGATTLVGPVTMNNSLTVSGNSCFADLGCWTSGGITNVTAVGIGAPAPPVTIPGVLLRVGDSTMNSVVNTDANGPEPGMSFTTGAHWNGTYWIADANWTLEYYHSVGPEHGWYIYGPQTVGQPQNATRAQYMALRANAPGETPGLAIESGGIAIVNGGIVATGGPLGNSIYSNFSTNGPDFIDSSNNNTGTSAAGIVRAANGTHATDMVQPGLNNSTLPCCSFAADRGYVASNGANGLIIEATGAGAGAGLYLSAPNANVVAIVDSAHIGFFNSGYNVPTVNAAQCGGAGAAMFSLATDSAGQVTTGNTPTSSCVITFGAGFANVGCICSTRANTWCAANASNSGISMTFGTPIANTLLAWFCFQN